MRRTAFLCAPLAFTAIVIACSSSDETPPATETPDAAADAAGATCDLGKTVVNAACNPSTSIVCNVVGAAVTCCPPEAPFYCPSTKQCYGSAADAYSACGSQPHTCLACPPQLDAGPLPTDAAPDATGDGAPGNDATGDDDGSPGVDANDGSTEDASDAESDATEDASDAGTPDAPSSDAADSGDAAG
jgi:hypothetical protein